MADYAEWNADCMSYVTTNPKEVNMNIPLIAITPTTAKMLAKYHAANGDKVTEAMWLRVGLTLFAANAYSDGHLTETEMHTHFTCATTWDDESLRDHAYAALKGC